MLRDLDLYHSIIEGDYEPAKDVNEMQMKLTLLRNDPARLAHWQNQAQRAAKEYSKEHLADVWTKFYQEQARKGMLSEQTKLVSIKHNANYWNWNSRLLIT